MGMAIFDFEGGTVLCLLYCVGEWESFLQLKPCLMERAWAAVCWWSIVRLEEGMPFE